MSKLVLGAAILAVLPSIGFLWDIAIRAPAPHVIAFFQSLPKYFADPRLYVLTSSSAMLALVFSMTVSWLGSSDAVRTLLVTLLPQNRVNEAFLSIASPSASLPQR